MKKEQYLPTYYQQFIAKSRYARWLKKEKRRERWDETVARYFDWFDNFLEKNHNGKLTKSERKELEDAVLNLEVMPSMRALMTAGKALTRNGIAAYNCAFIPVDSVRAFDETLLILMHGTGVGFSVERQYVNKLPEVPEDIEWCDNLIVVEDSKEGWQKGLATLVTSLYNGLIPKWNLDKVRPAGARLDTFGGRASGPDPLNDLFWFVINIFQKARGRKLSSLECHDIMCKIGEVVVVGGVRRSAMISFSNLSDDRMRHAKNGQWWTTDGQRALANNSAAYTEKPSSEAFLREWLALVESKSGERGIFNVEACVKQAMKNGRRVVNMDLRSNPCCEILLKMFQFCNLTSVTIRWDDSLDNIRRKARVAAILGTMQACITNFKGLRRKWKRVTEEERLLGVSLTGIMDHKFMRTQQEATALFLEELKQLVVDTNKEWAERFGIKQSTATTCVKPEGNSSQLRDCSSGIHTRFSQWFIRTVRADNKDPLTQLLKDQGVPWEPDVTKPDSTTVFSFPMQSPETSLFANDLTAIEQLEIWKFYQTHWCEHKPSATIYVREHEWIEVGAWVYKHFDEMTGVSFLPKSDHVYRQAPYQEITAEEFLEWIKKMPKSIDWDKLSEYEDEDNTIGMQTLACTGSSCEMVDLV